MSGRSTRRSGRSVQSVLPGSVFPHRRKLVNQNYIKHTRCSDWSAADYPLVASQPDLFNRRLVSRYCNSRTITPRDRIPVPPGLPALFVRLRHKPLSRILSWPQRRNYPALALRWEHTTQLWRISAVQHASWWRCFSWGQYWPASNKEWITLGKSNNSFKRMVQAYIPGDKSNRTSGQCYRPACLQAISPFYTSITHFSCNECKVNVPTWKVTLLIFT